MKKLIKSKVFLVSVLTILCVGILAACWFVSRSKNTKFIPDESPPAGSPQTWETATAESGAAGKISTGNHTPVPSNTIENYPKVVEETESEVVVDFTPTEKPAASPPPTPEIPIVEGDPAVEPPANSVPAVTAPPAQNNGDPAPGSSNGSGAVYDPVFGWVTPGDVSQSAGNSDGDPNTMVGNMG